METPRPRQQLLFKWPEPVFNIVLVEPDIPQNTGNIARLCAATGTTLNLVEPLGFQLTDKLVKRAGLDYWDAVSIRRHASFEAFLRSTAEGRGSANAGQRSGKPEAGNLKLENPGNNSTPSEQSPAPGTRHPKLLFFSTNGAKNYTDADYQPGDCLIFGSESKGLPLELLEANKEDVYNIPIQLGAVRSLNLSNAVSIVLYEALRQLNASPAPHSLQP